MCLFLIFRDKVHRVQKDQKETWEQNKKPKVNFHRRGEMTDKTQGEM